MSVELASLYQKCLAGTATAAEKSEMLLLLQHAGNEQRVKEYVEALLDAEKPATTMPADALASMVGRIVQADATRKTTPVRRIRRPLMAWGAAAATLMAITATWLILTTNNQSNLSHSAIRDITDIAPGRDGALLTLADGSQVLLDTIKNGGVVALQGGATAKVVNGALHYEGTGTALVYNTMSTPKGRQYHVILPDGTEAWLNAASSIRYPVAFTAGERKVEIKGEAYLEVAPDAGKPFVVTTPHTQVQVLGTAFNINAYDDEAAEITTLATGKVRVSSLAQGASSSVTLESGQAARSNSNAISTQAGNVAQAIAWKNGVFSFEDADIPTVMRQLSRWYNVEIQYEGQIPDRDFTGEIGKTLNLEQVLRILTKTRIHYEIEGKTLLIKP